MGTNRFSRESVPVFIRASVAIRDFPGAGQIPSLPTLLDTRMSKTLSINCISHQNITYLFLKEPHFLSTNSISFKPIILIYQKFNIFPYLRWSGSDHSVASDLCTFTFKYRLNDFEYNIIYMLINHKQMLCSLGQLIIARPLGMQYNHYVSVRPLPISENAYNS